VSRLILWRKTETITIFVKDSAGKPEKDSLGRMTGLCMWLSRAGFLCLFHIHPEDSAITDEMKTTVQYPVRYTFPKSGRYIVGIDFAVNDRLIQNIFQLMLPEDLKWRRRKKIYRAEKCSGV